MYLCIAQEHAVLLPPMVSFTTRAHIRCPVDFSATDSVPQCPTSPALLGGELGAGAVRHAMLVC